MRSFYRERPDYRVDLLARTNVMTAWLGEIRLARSSACLTVDEQDHGLVVYFPPDAVDFGYLEPAPERTVCPFKGQAVYWRAAGRDGPGIAWSYPEPFPEVARLAGYVAFDQDEVRVAIGKGRYTGDGPVTESTLERMLAVFDVTPLGPDQFGTDRFAGDSDGGDWHGGERRVVDGSQLLGQSLVAAGKALPGRVVRSAHALFVSVADPAEPLEFGVATVRAGRSFASAVVTVSQGGRTRATATVLLDQPQPDVIRHDRWSGPPPAGPEAAYPAEMPMRGRQLRLEEVRDHGSPDETGPPVLDAWLRYDTVPARDDLRRALLAHFTGHLSISAAMRAHPGIGTAQAHHTVSTAVMGIGVSFHDPLAWDGWIRYHHESAFAGAGMAYARGQVLTADGRLLASFTQDAMIRALGAPAASVPSESRL